MKKTTEMIREKAAHHLALNLSELARVSGYRRTVLAGMNLPLQAGKITLTDFRRVIRRRQDLLEEGRVFLSARLPAENPESIQRLADRLSRVPRRSVKGPLVAFPKAVSAPPAGPSPSGADSRLQKVADRFDAPSRTRAGQAASRLRGAGPARSSAK